VVDPVNSSVALPAGVGIDPGAIGKGLAADVIAGELYDAGADGVLVNLGGDLAFIGATADGSGWTIGVEDERRPVGDDDRILRRFEFPDGSTTAGIATSTTLKRRWAQGRRHHVIDPRTGSMSISDLVQVTIVADEAWHAEVLATTALLMTADEAERWLRDTDITAILVTADTAVVTTDEEDDHG
jgi:thiamine biosynthesis lipoprotein